MCQILDEAILAAQQAGMEPIARIELGRRQFEEFVEWCESKGIATSPSPGNPHEYDGIPIVQVDKESRRTVIGGTGDQILILE